MVPELVQSQRIEMRKQKNTGDLLMIVIKLMSDNDISCRNNTRGHRKITHYYIKRENKRIFALEKDKCNSIMDTNNIDFVTYCIGNLARRLNLSQLDVYTRLKNSGILTEYIIPSYDVLHTFSKEYLMEDLMDYIKEKGVLS